MLVGTASVRESEALGAALRRAASRAKSSTRDRTRTKRRSSRAPGALGAVTISTNMAGRGTDIVLGGPR